MKLTEVVIIVGIFFSLSLFGVQSFLLMDKLNTKNRNLAREVNCEKFIAESFRNTCKGKGFKSLNEWQVTCREMFDLDYIGWSNASDFMEVNYETCSKNLYYGKWIFSGVDGEVYCRGF